MATPAEGQLRDPGTTVAGERALLRLLRETLLAGGRDAERIKKHS